MSFSLTKISSYYKDFLSDYYKKNQQVLSLSYSKQHKHLMLQANGWANFYTNKLQSFDVKTNEIVANAEPLQKQWAAENNCNKTGIQLVIEQLKKQKPQVVWFQDILTFNGEIIREIKKSVPSIKLVIGNLCAPFTNNLLKSFYEFDFITTCSPLFKRNFEQQGLKTLLLYQAFEPTINEKINSNTKTTDLIFIGNIISGKGYHDERKLFLEKILEKNINLKFYGNIYNNNTAEVLKKQILFTATNMIDKFRLSKYFKNNIIYKKGAALTSFPRKNVISKKFKNINNPAKFGLDMFEIISNSKISLNIHGDVAGDYAANMRMFETTGVGTCLLTDWKKNIHELFEIDKEIVTYKTADECIEKTKWLLANPQKTEEIAKAGQERTLKEHNYQKRAELLHKEIKKYLS